MSKVKRVKKLKKGQFIARIHYDLNDGSGTTMEQHRIGSKYDCASLKLHVAYGHNLCVQTYYMPLESDSYGRVRFAFQGTGFSGTDLPEIFSSKLIKTIGDDGDRFTCYDIDISADIACVAALWDKYLKYLEIEKQTGGQRLIIGSNLKE